MSNPELAASLFCAPLLLGSCVGISSYAPSLDVYGSYFPAWLICLGVGVIMTIGVRLIGVFNLGVVRMLGPLVPISLILISVLPPGFCFLLLNHQVHECASTIARARF
jgi:YtcA family